MFGDIFKVFVEEPEKLNKAAISALKMIFNIIIASWFYRQFIGPYKIIDITSYIQWAEFLLSGRILLCILFYSLCDMIFVPIISAIAYLPILLISKINFSLSYKDFRFILRLFDIVEFDQESYIPKPGRNIDILYDISKSLEEKEGQNEAKLLKDIFIANIWELYAIFIVVYFFILDLNSYYSSLNTIVIATLTLLLLVYCAIRFIVDYMLNNYREINFGLALIKANKVIYDTLAEFCIFPVKPEEREKIKRAEVFCYNNKEYILSINYSKTPRTFDKVVEIAHELASREKHLFMVTNQQLNERTNSLIKENRSVLTVISYSDDKDLEEKIKTELNRL